MEDKFLKKKMVMMNFSIIPENKIKFKKNNKKIKL